MRSDQFPTTRWSLIRSAAREAGSAEHEALAALCERYWPPLYVYARRLGRSASDAEDVTQAFFTRILSTDFLSAAKPQRGRFRSFLLASFQHFLSNEWHSSQAAKRGGGRVLAVDFQAEEQRRFEPTDTFTPDAVFRRRWALAVLEAALDAVREQWIASGKRDIFQRLAPLLTGDGLDTSYRDFAATLGMSEGAVRVMVHRLRRQFAAAVREQVTDTVSSAEEVDEEMRELLNALAGPV